MAAVWEFCVAIRWSLLAWLVFTVIGFLGMGALGYALYLPVSPLLAPAYGTAGSWSGDWVWPSTLVVGMAWPVCFVIAGVLRHLQVQAGWPEWLAIASYATVLWVGALLAWWAVLAANAPR